MTHTRPLRDDEGDFSSWSAPAFFTCRADATHHEGKTRIWESKDGAYEDRQYRCTTCGHTWWVDGIDS